MNKPLSAEEVANLSMPIPIVEPMTRREKLMHFAQIVRAHPYHMALYHNLEGYPDHAYESMGTGHSAFAVPATDAIFRNAGYTGSSVGEAKRFFELSRDDLHEFSCDCGGVLTNQDMADRIEKIAGRVPPTQIVIDSKSWTG